MHLIDFICYLNDKLIKFRSPILKTLFMKMLDFKEKFLPKKVLCSMMGHKFIVTRTITNHFKEYKCSVCDVEITNDDKGQKTYLTPELKEINETLICFHNKKLHLV